MHPETLLDSLSRDEALEALRALLRLDSARDYVLGVLDDMQQARERNAATLTEVDERALTEGASDGAA
jgi:hypothetical protein